MLFTKKPRRAYCGYSTAICYDYSQKDEIFPSEFNCISNIGQNPILEAPYGLMLLFDEIWFPTEYACPFNMRKLPYVKYLDEEERYKYLFQDKEKKCLIKFIHNYFIDRGKWTNSYRKEYQYHSSNNYLSIINKLNIGWDSDLDSRAYFLTNNGPNQGAHDEISILHDMIIMNKIHNDGFELISNSITSKWLERADLHTFSFENEVHGSSIKTQILNISEKIIVGNIPNYQMPMGPYHPCIEDVRNNCFLQDYRDWIKAKGNDLCRKEITEIIADVNNEIQKSQKKLFLRHLDPKSHYRSAAKSGAKTAIDLFSWGSGKALDFAERATNLNQSKKLRWQGFVVSTKNTINDFLDFKHLR